MAAPNIDLNRPNYDSTAKDADLQQLRDNIVWLMFVAAAAQYALPGWSTVVTYDGSDIDTIVMTKNSTTIKMRWTFTWSSGLPATQVWEFDKGLGSGYETLTDGTVTFTFNGSNQFTGATSA